MVAQKNVFILFALEGVVLASAMLRVVVTQVDLSSPPRLIWLAATVLLAASALAHFIVRSSLLRPRIKAGDPVEDELKQYFTISVALLVGAALLSLAGPEAVQRLLG